MKAFYGVVIASLLLLAAVPLSQPIYSNNAYFNGPVKKVQQRIYGLNGHEVSDQYSPSGLPFSYRPPSINNVEFPAEKLLLEAFDMHFDIDGKLLFKKRYDGEGNRLSLQVKVVWDSLGEYEQIKHKIGREYRDVLDSVVRHYNPETHILTRFHWHRKPSTPWKAVPLETDSVLQIGDYPLLYFSDYKIISTHSASAWVDGSYRKILVVQKLEDSTKIDTILYHHKDNRVSRFSQFNAKEGYLADFDSLGRNKQIVRTELVGDQVNKVVRKVYNHDPANTNYFIESFHHKSSGDQRWTYNKTKSHYFFDRLGQQTRWESSIIKGYK
ncbi:MAG: hypothetical protein AAFN10_23310 [Bacteroidota bacterium]